MNISFILLAAGNSTRLGIPCKKQNLHIGNLPLWLYVAKQYEKMYDFEKIIIVCDDPKHYKHKEEKYCYVKGGKERSDSIKNALNEIDSEFVLINDVARVFLDKKVLDELLKNIKNYDCVFPGINVSDTVFNEKLNKYENRNDLKLVQTPQISRTVFLKNINLSGFTDESSAVLANKGRIKIVQGSELSFKLTNKDDLTKLKLLNLAKPSKNTFIGYGYDVHEFCFSNKGHILDKNNKNEKLILAGVDLGNKYALKAHSDGDVVAHSIIDALFGACCLDDIGNTFSDKDDKYKNADSMKLLSNAYQKCQAYGFELVNLDITIAAEQPKLSQFKDDMKRNLVKTLNCFNINIKATTTEKIGFVGRVEGISVSVVANMKLFDWSTYENIDS